jgi:hypothetical protein
MLLYFKIYFNNIEVISYSNKGPISTRTEEVLKLKICVNNNVLVDEQQLTRYQRQTYRKAQGHFANLNKLNLFSICFKMRK